MEENFRKYKKEVEDSPITILKNEITRKEIQNEEMEKQKKKLEEEIRNKNQIIEKLKADMIKLRKNYETEKENMYKQRIEEVEKLKFDIFNQRSASEEMKEIQELKEKIKELTMIKKNEINMQQDNVMQNQQQNISQQGIINYPSPENLEKSKKIYTIISYNRKDGYNKVPKNNLEKLIMEREQMLKSGMYKENDPLIAQLDNKIKRLSDNY